MMTLMMEAVPSSDTDLTMTADDEDSQHENGYVNGTDNTTDTKQTVRSSKTLSDDVSKALRVDTYYGLNVTSCVLWITVILWVFLILNIFIGSKLVKNLKLFLAF